MFGSLSRARERVGVRVEACVVIVWQPFVGWAPCAHQTLARNRLLSHNEGGHGVPTLQLTTLRMCGPFNRDSCAKTLTPTLSPRERGPNGGFMRHDSISKTCRKYVRYDASSHIVFAGVSESLATGCPLQRIILITICSGV